jgi:hypothetical protein
MLSSSLFAAEETTYQQIERNGLYTGMTTGYLYYTGNDRLLYQDNWVVGLKAGYQIFRYVAVEALFKFSAHQANVISPTQGIPNSFFTYQTILQAKGSWHLTDRVRLNVGGGAGFFSTSPNQKSAVGGSMRPMGYGEVGAEYFLKMKGFSLGLDPSIAGVRDLKAPVVQLTGFIRYTF